MEPQHQAIDVRDLLWRLRRYGWLIALPIVASLCAAAVYYKYSTRVYTSSIVVSVDANSQPTPALDPLVRAMMNRANPRERVSIVDSKIHSRAFLGILVEKLGMNTNPELIRQARVASQRWKEITPEEYAMRVAVTRLGRMISVSPGRESLIQITATTTDAESARRLAELIGEVLVEESRHSTLAGVQARGEFSSDQIAVYEERLQKAEDALRVFQESTLRKGFSLGIITTQNLATARGLQRSTDDAIEQLRARIQTARSEWQATMGNVAIPELKGPLIAELTDELGDLETNLALAMLRGPESRDESNGLQARIAAARQALFAEFEHLAGVAPGRYSTEARAAMAGFALDRAVLRSMEDRQNRLTSEIESYLKSVEGTPRDDLELRRLSQEVETSRNFLTSLRQEATSSRVSEALASSSLGPRLDIIEHPLLPLFPSAPEPRKIFGMAVLLGPLIAAGIVFAGERLASVLRSLEQTEAEYGHRVIGTVPRIDGWSRPGSYLRNHWAALAVVLVLLLTGLAFAVNVTPPAEQATTSPILGLHR